VPQKHSFSRSRVIGMLVSILRGGAIGKPYFLKTESFKAI